MKYYYREDRKYDKMGISQSQYIPIYREDTIYIYIYTYIYIYIFPGILFFLQGRYDIYKMLEPENPSG